MRALREIDVRKILRPLAIAFGIFALLIIVTALLHAALFGPAGEEVVRTEFIVAPDTSLASTADALEEGGFVRDGFIFQIAYALSRREGTVRPGGYLISPSMDTWAVAKTLGQAPYLAWVTIPQALRREEVAEVLAEQLSWTAREQQEWLLAASATTTALTEGVFYPDVYLIPSDQSPEQVVERLRDRFNLETEMYMQEANEKDIPWSDVLTLASLIERESAKNDKKLVSGILWNRLNKDMLLQVDATLQYVIGSSENNWWPAPKSEDKYVESPFNTYQNVGLPPSPIATPTLASIDAALNPQKTSCLYYLHDSRGRIHCSTNYKGHLANVNLYLR